jgi:hypothetical protein
VPSAGVSPAGGVVSFAGGVVVVVVVVPVSLHPATTNAAQTSINANKLLIAKSPENELVSKTLHPRLGRASNMGQHLRSV